MRRFLWIGGTLIVAVAIGVLLAPSLVRSYWSHRSSNPVRRGVALAKELGCFRCHGHLGMAGLPDPGVEGGEVPDWGGGVWMMYVENEQEVREFIRDGISQRRLKSLTAMQELENAAIVMPAYGEVLGSSDLDDLTAAFLVLSGMRRPPGDTPAAAGLAVARRWQCLQCHGPAGSGGLENPGSFTGFIPGWYGADFRDLVRDRSEFDAWIREGALDRLSSHPIASRYLESQRVHMPAYPDLRDEDLDALWAYASWLSETGGGVRPDQAAADGAR